MLRNSKAPMAGMNFVYSYLPILQARNAHQAALWTHRSYSPGAPSWPENGVNHPPVVGHSHRKNDGFLMDFNILMGILMVILRMLMGFSIIAIGNVGFFYFVWTNPYAWKTLASDSWFVMYPGEIDQQGFSTAMVLEAVLIFFWVSIVHFMEKKKGFGVQV